MTKSDYSEFRVLVSAWDAALLREELEGKVRGVVNSPSISFLFSKDGEIYGGNESARVTFAKLKDHRKSEDPAGWKDDADFMGVKLINIINDDSPTYSIFTKKDLRSIKVLEPQEAEKRLLRRAKQNDLG